MARTYESVKKGKADRERKSAKKAAKKSRKKAAAAAKKAASESESDEGKLHAS